MQRSLKPRKKGQYLPGEPIKFLKRNSRLATPSRWRQPGQHRPEPPRPRQPQLEPIRKFLTKRATPSQSQPQPADASGELARRRTSSRLGSRSFNRSNRAGPARSGDHVRPLRVYEGGPTRRRGVGGREPADLDPSRHPRRCADPLPRGALDGGRRQRELIIQIN